MEHKQHTGARAPVKTVVGRVTTATGRTAYDVLLATGEVRRLTVRETSEIVAKRAVEQFEAALRRLADR